MTTCIFIALSTGSFCHSRIDTLCTWTNQRSSANSGRPKRPSAPAHWRKNVLTKRRERFGKCGYWLAHISKGALNVSCYDFMRKGTRWNLQVRLEHSCQPNSQEHTNKVCLRSWAKDLSKPRPRTKRGRPSAARSFGETG